MKGMITAAALSLLVGAAHAGEDYYVIPETGDDNAACLVDTPCKTVEAAVSKMSPGSHVLYLAPGEYDLIDITHHRSVWIVPIGTPTNGTCIMDTVTVRSVIVQDNATAWVSCLTVQQVRCRQWSTVDVIDVTFRGGPGVALAANETCRINTTRTIRIAGQIPVFAFADNFSTLYITGSIEITAPDLQMEYFVAAVDAKVDLSLARFSGHPLVSGEKYMLDHATIVFPEAGASAIPGNGYTSKNYSVCRPC